MKKTMVLLTLLLISLGLASAQTTNEKIVFPNSPNTLTSEGQFLVQTADGGYLLTGTASNENTGNYALPRLIKLTADLQVEWDKNYFVQLPPHGTTVWFYTPAQQTPDGGYAMAVQNDSLPTDFVRLDAQGNVLWEKDFAPWINAIQLLGVLPDGGYALTIKTQPYELLHLDADGNVVTRTTLPVTAFTGYAQSILLSNGEVLTAYQVPNTQKTRFLRTNIDGNVIWHTAPTALEWWANLGKPQLTAMPDGGFVTLFYDDTLNNNRLHRFNALGSQTWQSPETAIPATLRPTSVEVTSNGRFLLSGHTTTNRGFIAQMNAAADGIEWSAESPEDGQPHLTTLNAIPTTDGWAAGVGNTVGDKFGFLKVGVNSGISVNVLSGRVAKDDDESCAVETAEPGLVHTKVEASNGLETFVAFTDFNGNYQMTLPHGDYTLSVQTNELFFFLCPTANVTVAFPAGTNGTANLDLPVQSLDLIHEISGTLYFDQNQNCAADAGEPGLKNWKVKIFTGAGTLNLTTNADGAYKAFVPDGTYQVWAVPLNNNFQICAPSPQFVNLVGPTPQTATLDFVAQPELLCAKMRIDLARSNFRPCMTGNLVAYYRNDGTTTANNASMTVTLDPHLTYVDAEQTPDVIDGQTLTFQLGNLEPALGSEWQSIKIHVAVDCALAIGDQVCVSSTVSPNEDCTDEPEWSGAIISVSGVCENDERAIFTIRNIGNAASANLEYIIVEDQIVLHPGGFQLGIGDAIQDTVSANGLPLTIIADQEPGYPGDTSVVWNILNCGNMGMSTGNGSGFGGPAGPYNYQECFSITGSYDPNDKNAIPQGSGPSHFVHPGTPLEYHIRFQNTGNDTAFLVVIRDTLSRHFDYAKIEPRGSSHTYEFAQISDSIVQFTFENILLPDSTTNLEGSQGFVEFNVYPKPNLPNGTPVFNSAAIYFDYNQPVITNTVQRVYGKYAFVKIKEITGKTALPVQVYPNPFISEATFEIPANAPSADYQLTLFDGLGRTLRTLSFVGNKCLLRREDLPVGALTWSISADGQIVAGGTVVAW